MPVRSGKKPKAPKNRETAGYPLGWCSLVKSAELLGLELVPANVFWPAVLSTGAEKDEALALWSRAEWDCQRPSDSLLGVASSWLWVPLAAV
eukprot:symbB.v1.2.030603.t1/scaffold3469.1/size56133/3